MSLSAVLTTLPNLSHLTMAGKEVIDLDSDVAEAIPAPKRQYQENTGNEIDSQNKKTIDSILFDWSSESIVYVTKPSWDQAITSKLSKERPDVPTHPISAFEELSASKQL